MLELNKILVDNYVGDFDIKYFYIYLFLFKL